MKAQDILTSTHELEESGMTRSQSEAIAKTIIAAVEPLATKTDLDSRLESLENRIDGRFAGVNTQLARWAFALVLSQAAVGGLIVTLLS